MVTLPVSFWEIPANHVHFPRALALLSLSTALEITNEENHCHHQSGLNFGDILS